jgi:NTE family protein
MEQGWYEGDRRRNYCAKCEIDYGASKGQISEPTCDKCGSKLRTKFAGLALSGGGFRATLFHLGGLWRLNELGWLRRLAEVTSVSGGSITAGYLGFRWKHLAFESNGTATNFVEEIVQPLQGFCSRTIDSWSVLAPLINPLRRPPEVMASHYLSKLFGTSTLQDLPPDKEGPRFTIYATSLQTGVNVRFSRTELAEYYLGKIESPRIQLATAVAASSAFPPALCPVILKLNPADWKDWETGEKSDLREKARLRSEMLLADGGIYDNLGLDRVWDQYSTVLVSDAGASLSVMMGSVWIQLSLLMRAKRAIDITTEYTRSRHKQWLISDLEAGAMRGTYWGIATKIGDYKLKESGHSPPLVNDSENTRSLCHMRTRLNRFRAEEQEKLINWGYALADAAMRRHVLEKGTEPGRLPFPDRAF